MRCGRLSDTAPPRVPDRQDSPGETVAEDQGLPIARAGPIALTMTIVLGVGRTRQASYPDSAGQTSRSDRSLTASGQYPLPPRHQPWPTNRVRHRLKRGHHVYGLPAGRRVDRADFHSLGRRRRDRRPVERMFSPRVLRAIYADELERLACVRARTSLNMSRDHLSAAGEGI